VLNGMDVGTGATLKAGCTAMFVVAVGKVAGALRGVAGDGLRKIRTRKLKLFCEKIIRLAPD